MLPKKNRLTVLQFNQIPQKSQGLNNNYFIIKIKKNNNNGPKFVVIVPKFLDKRSTQRHLTKRIINEALKKEIKNTEKSASILIKAKKILNKESAQSASAQLRILLKEINNL